MFNAFRCPLIPVVALVAGASLVACSKPTSRADAAVQQSAAPTPTAAPAGCTGSWLGPSAVPPEQGVWTDRETPDSTRVVAMIGPADVRTGSTEVTRTIETIEGVDRSEPIRTRADAAVMHLELLPRYPADGRAAPSSKASAGLGTEPGAAYALTSLISLVSYEACVGPPAVRYLRRDARRAIARDVMLRRVSALK